MHHSTQKRDVLLFGAIVALLTYGTLFPWAGWRPPSGSLWDELLVGTNGVSPGSGDANLLIFMLLGFFAARIYPGTSQRISIMCAAVAGAFVSLSLEITQAFIPDRVSSYFDLGLNTAGAIIGGVVAVKLVASSRIAHQLHALRTAHLRPGSLTTVGLVTITFWLFDELAPFVPSLDPENIKQGLRPFAELFSAEEGFSASIAIGYGAAIFAVATIIREITLPRKGRSKLIGLFILSVMGAKLVVVGQQLSPEILLGTLVGLALYRITRYLMLENLTAFSIVALFIFLILTGSPFGSRTAIVAEFTWVPLVSYFSSDPISLTNIFTTAWPYCGLAFLTILAAQKYKLSFSPSAVIVASVAVAVEWQQRLDPERFADITDVLIAVAAFTLPWVLLDEQHRSAPAPSRQKRRRRKRSTRPPLVGTTAIIIGGFGVGVVLSTLDPVVTEQAVEPEALYNLPEVNSLPAVSFAEFRDIHPRLPAPSAEDIARLRKENPDYLSARIGSADAGRGELNASIFAEFVEPGSQDLDHLYERLMELEFVSRGNVQSKPLTLAYDWLYDRWTDEQREALRSKVIDGCEFIIGAIREKRLSPYNVFLYNSPLQALVACSFATFREDERADAVMRFTHDMWTLRVLPVWRQVMGENGGWHEGGEYVALSVGQAVYQIPAMWRRVTGVDYFSSEPGLRGFLDFLVYRRRPDGTDIRLGDAGFFERQVPDRVALALEYRHSAAYSLGECPKRIAPTSWPWGPLPDDSLCDEMAQNELPLAKLFDGIGLLVARSDWQPNATYVTFNGGDNYWSHTHLHQGAFTIFKRQPLAIDSGIYGTGYGSDHHMNYAYQTIAHNTITVTDPLDDVAAPKGDALRSFANDGGQRRVGSGWGINGAPLDITEWMNDEENYHTATILNYEETAAHVIVKADLTAAYTNRWSGLGTFAHRTKRIEKFIRTFIFDREIDAVIVFDQLKLTTPHLTSRWLLHSVTKPDTTKSGFDLQVKGSTQRKSTVTAGLNARVVLPRQRNINAIGGPGFEFFVDGTNYDDDGETDRIQEKRSNLEPGEWRVEIQPTIESTDIDFLVFLFPWSDLASTDSEFVCDEIGERIVDCTIRAEPKTAHYHFNRETNEVRVDHEATWTE